MTQETNYRRLLVAPHGIRRGLLDRIEGEIANHEAGLPSGVKIKVNSVVDEALIDALYRASQAGVPVDMLVRGICTIRPGVPGLSENVRVRSILGRFLEHSRVFWFAGGGRPTVGIGSSDLMHRNLDRRVEAIVSLTHADHIRQVEDLFAQAFSPGIVHWELTDSEWTAHTTDEEGTPLIDLQESLIQQAKARRATR